MLNALLSNPELLQRMGSILGSMSQAPPSADSGGEGTEQAVAPAALGEGLGAVLSNPAMLEKLPEIMATLKPLMASSPSASSEKPSAEANRERLLLALKPFLSPARCEAVDSILRISKLGAVFQALK